MFIDCYICGNVYSEQRKQCPTCGSFPSFINGKVIDVIVNDTLGKVIPINEAWKGAVRASFLVNKTPNRNSWRVKIYSEWIAQSRERMKTIHLWGSLNVTPPEKAKPLSEHSAKVDSSTNKFSSVQKEYSDGIQSASSR